jgi:energy-coupling factor transporter ATP-binding protein EcfA2
MAEPLRDVAFSLQCHGAPAETILASARTALERINADHLIGRRIDQLSAGERQRVALAAVLAPEPAVLLLDEATSALDNESERIVQAALDQVVTALKRTTITIAHRLSTIRDADKIVVLSDGVVVEEGTFDSLLVLGGAFSVLAQRQESARAADAKLVCMKQLGFKAPRELSLPAPITSPVFIDKMRSLIRRCPPSQTAFMVCRKPLVKTWPKCIGLVGALKPSAFALVLHCPRPKTGACCPHGSALTI